MYVSKAGQGLLLHQAHQAIEHLLILESLPGPFFKVVQALEVKRMRGDLPEQRFTLGDPGRGRAGPAVSEGSLEPLMDPMASSPPREP